jgi:hypothetical protein
VREVSESTIGFSVLVAVYPTYLNNPTHLYNPTKRSTRQVERVSSTANTLGQHTDKNWSCGPFERHIDTTRLPDLKMDLSDVGKVLLIHVIIRGHPLTPLSL